MTGKRAIRSQKNKNLSCPFHFLLSFSLAFFFSSFGLICPIDSFSCALRRVTVGRVSVRARIDGRSGGWVLLPSASAGDQDENGSDHGHHQEEAGDSDADGERFWGKTEGVGVVLQLFLNGGQDLLLGIWDLLQWRTKVPVLLAKCFAISGYAFRFSPVSVTN